MLTFCCINSLSYYITSGSFRKTRRDVNDNTTGSLVNWLRVPYGFIQSVPKHYKGLTLTNCLISYRNIDQVKYIHSNIRRIDARQVISRTVYLRCSFKIILFTRKSTLKEVYSKIICYNKSKEFKLAEATNLIITTYLANI